MTPDPEFMKWLASLGVGGAIAGFMFLFYRRDTLSFVEQLKGQADLWRGQSEALMQVVKENTAAIVRLQEGIEKWDERREAQR